MAAPFQFHTCGFYTKPICYRTSHPPIPLLAVLLGLSCFVKLLLLVAVIAGHGKRTTTTISTATIADQPSQPQIHQLLRR